MLIFAALALVSWFGGAWAIFEVETGGVKVVRPATDRVRFDMALANFGHPVYGAQLVGQLVYPEPSGEYGPWKHECTPAACNYGCAPFGEAKPEFRIEREAGKRYILLLDRGPKEASLPRPCYFLDKVYHAQLAGADAVLVANDHPGDLSTAVAPKDEDSKSELRDLTISAGLISQESGAKLKQLLKKGPVTIALNWTDVLPRSDRVQWEFWTNSNDECGATCDAQRKFIKGFKNTGMFLEQKGLARFTPHYLIWVCQTAKDTPEECASQCIRGGKYCCPDPDDDIHKGYSGRDVLRMNLRALCVHRVASAAGKPWLWWQFVDRLGDTCSMKGNKYTSECATDVFKEVVSDQLGSPDQALHDWQACWGIGDEDSTQPLPMLEDELKAQTGNGSESTVAMLPTVRINQKQYRGGLEAASVLRALCASFPVGSEPAVCNERWVSDNECDPGSEGDKACKAQGAAQPGRTRCINTFAGAGYKCVCGQGFVKVTDRDTGAERCADMNECLLSSVPWTDPKCKCDRCACINSVGGYRCSGPLPNMCTAENKWGGCWHTEDQGQVVHACVDNIHEYRSLAAFGRLNGSVATYRCQCPPCWRPTGPNNDGCERVCDSAQCDKLHGVCFSNEVASARGGSSGRGVTVILSTLLGMLAAIGAVFGLYQLHIRRRMQDDVRTILEEYVPLNSAPSPSDGATPTSVQLFSALSADPSEERLFASARSSARTSTSSAEGLEAFLPSRRSLQ